MGKITFILVCTLFAGCFLVPAWAGEVHGRVLISRNITKKRVTAPNNQLRGPAVAVPPNDDTLAAEYKRLAIYLEDDPSLPPAPR